MDDIIMLNVVSDLLKTGWTCWIFFIENFIMAEIVQPSDKIKLIFILF